MLDFRVYKLQATLFTPQLNISNTLKIANDVISLIGNHVGIEPSILPVPKDAPLDIPRIIFSSDDRKWTLNIAPERTNLFFNITPASKEKGDFAVSDFLKIAKEFYINYPLMVNTEIQRIAFVTERSVFPEDSFNLVLKRFANRDQIEKGRPFNNTKRFEIHSLKKYPWNNFNLNSWVRMKCMPIKFEDGDIIEGILVINDLNTLSFNEEPDVVFDSDRIGFFFDNIEDHLNEILRLYFD